MVGAGPGAERFSEGDRVMAIVGGGGQAELALVHERQLMPVPDALDWPEAGGFPEVFTTAHDAVFTQAGLRRRRAPAGARRRGRRRHRGGPAGPRGGGLRDRDRARRGSATAVEELGAEAIDPEGFVDAGPFDVILELVGAPEPGGQPQGAGHAGPDRGDRHRRRREGAS